MSANASASFARLTPATYRAWEQWLDVAGERVHIGYERLDPDHSRHTALCLDAAAATAARLAAAWTSAAPPRRVLDIGSSAGFKAFALQALWPDAEIVGLDPDDRAIELGKALAADPMIRAWMGTRSVPELRVGVGEAMPWPDGYFDMVICLTTIEHVADVGATVAEIGRVLAHGGIAVIEAPNYLWPTEPHLGIVVPPLAPKPLMRLCARLQGKQALAWYLDHLKLVHPRMLERMFRAGGMRFVNLSKEKLLRIARGDQDDVVFHTRWARLLAWLRSVGLAGPLARTAGRLGLYPSLLYRLERE